MSYPRFLRAAPALLGITLFTQLPVHAQSPVELVLDSGDSGNQVGQADVDTGAYRQFLWFNRFTPAAGAFPLLLEEIWFYAPRFFGPPVGAPMDLVVYRDGDDDPSNGAELLRVIPVAAGPAEEQRAGWSVHELNPPILISEPGDVLLGAINRYWDPDNPTAPVDFPAFDDNAATSEGRSWIAVWEDAPPPAAPDLASADTLFRADQPTGNSPPVSNWMLRGYGRSQPVLAVPTLSTTTMGILAVGLGAIAWHRQRRRPAR